MTKVKKVKKVKIDIPSPFRSTLNYLSGERAVSLIKLNISLPSSDALSSLYVYFKVIDKKFIQDNVYYVYTFSMYAGMEADYPLDAESLGVRDDDDYFDILDMEFYDSDLSQAILKKLNSIPYFVKNYGSKTGLNISCSVEFDFIYQPINQLIMDTAPFELIDSGNMTAGFVDGLVLPRKKDTFSVSDSTLFISKMWPDFRNSCMLLEWSSHIWSPFKGANTSNFVSYFSNEIYRLLFPHGMESPFIDFEMSVLITEDKDGNPVIAILEVNDAEGIIKGSSPDNLIYNSEILVNMIDESSPLWSQGRVVHATPVSKEDVPEFNCNINNVKARVDEDSSFIPAYTVFRSLIIGDTPLQLSVNYWQ